MIGLLLFLDGPQQMDTSCPNSDLDGYSDVWDSWLRVVGYGSSEQNQNCNNLLNTLHKIGGLDLDRLCEQAVISSYLSSSLFTGSRSPETVIPHLPSPAFIDVQIFSVFQQSVSLVCSPASWVERLSCDSHFFLSCFIDQSLQSLHSHWAHSSQQKLI